jgi:hypothetical protein
MDMVKSNRRSFDFGRCGDLRSGWQFKNKGDAALLSSCSLAVSSGVAAAAIARERVFPACVVTGVAYVALSIARFVSMEVVEGLRAVLRKRSMITVAGVVAVVDVAVEAVRAVEPGTGSKKDAAYEPIGTVVAIGSAVIRGIVEVPVGALGCYSNVDRNLGRHRRWGAEERYGES